MGEIKEMVYQIIVVLTVVRVSGAFSLVEVQARYRKVNKVETKAVTKGKE